MMNDFVYEAEVLYDLNGAGGAPRLLAVGSDKPIIIMEFCEGVTLKSFLQTDDAKDKNKVYALFVDVCRNLSEVHDKGYSHDDVHPGNILVCGDKDSFYTRIIDFGLASKNGEHRFGLDLDPDDDECCSEDSYQDVFSVLSLVHKWTGYLSRDQVKTMASCAFNTKDKDRATPMVRVVTMLENLSI